MKDCPDLSAACRTFLDGAVLPALPGHESRPSQTAMMDACCRRVEEGGVLLVEAGTGTGKTFAYLLPLILSGRKAVVSTRTKNLQEQLVGKDLALLSSVRPFSYAIAKGRSNYLCLRRLNSFTPRNETEASGLRAITAWSVETSTGDFEETRLQRHPVCDDVCSDGDACGKTKCRFFKDCFYYKARMKWEDSQIIVANHALLSLNAMMPVDSKVLPKADTLVIDEAHALDNVLSGVIGIDISNRRAEKLLSRLLRTDDRGKYKGLLADSPALYSPLESLREEIGTFWNRVSYVMKNRERIKDGFEFEAPLRDLADSVRTFCVEVRASVLGLFEENEEIELGAALIKLRAFADEMEVFAGGGEGAVRWPEIGERLAGLRMVPMFPGEFVRRNLISDFRSVVLASATLSVKGGFGLIKHILGIEEAETLGLPSPFDIPRQVSVSVKRGINLIEDASAAEKLSTVIIDEAINKDGGILALFTSRDVMQRTWDLASGPLTEMGLYPMLQGEYSNSAMLEIMRSGNNSVVFGLDSFWEGVDVRGDSLKCLIITKLPFEVPTEPVAAARMEAVRQSGGDPFSDYSLPRAILKFKQGFGRLIRSATDTGRVIICDERVETKGYGRMFLESVL